MAVIGLMSYGAIVWLFYNSASFAALLPVIVIIPMVPRL